MFILDQGGSIKNSLLFRWCDGTLATIEQVFGSRRAVPGWSGEAIKGGAWQGRDLMGMKELERRQLLGIGSGKRQPDLVEGWVKFWSEGRPRRENEEGKEV